MQIIGYFLFLFFFGNLGAFPGRVTYVVGKDGTVKSIFDDLVNAAVHPDKALAALAAK